MGNSESSEAKPPPIKEEPTPKKGFPGSSLLDNVSGGLCGSTNNVINEDEKDKSMSDKIWECVASPLNSPEGGERKKGDSAFMGADDDSFNAEEAPSYDQSSMNPTSALFARALVSEVTDNPNTMTPAAMAERERRLLKAQQAARQHPRNGSKDINGGDGPRPVGAPGGVGKPSIIGSIKHAFGNEEELDDESQHPPTKRSSVLPPNSLQESKAAQANDASNAKPHGKHFITIGLSLSRRYSTVGHPDTVTRQTSFDFNELQDREYQYVSSTDSSGWLAGGGEIGGDPKNSKGGTGISLTSSDEEFLQSETAGALPAPTGNHKVASPDTIHIPILHIDAESSAAVDAIISALARGEVFIPHMAILPEALSANGASPPDLTVRFGCERNHDIPPEEWPNWCLEFMHNQLFEYFQNMGARWTNRPFQITLAKKVRWKTVKHMNRYFAHAERVIDAWREKGPQDLDPQLSHIEGGATSEEVSRPHGIYLMRNGVPTNYFAPNFEPPYTTKMTRSLLMNVLGKSWDNKSREWQSEPVPKLITASSLAAAMCGCTDAQPGFMAGEVTNVGDTLIMPESPPTRTFEKIELNGAGNVVAQNKLDGTEEKMSSLLSNDDDDNAPGEVQELLDESRVDGHFGFSPSAAASPSQAGISPRSRRAPNGSPQSDAKVKKILEEVLKEETEDVVFKDDVFDEEDEPSPRNSESALSTTGKSIKPDESPLRATQYSLSSSKATGPGDKSSGPGSKYLASISSPGINRNDSDSGASLDYSMDSSMLAGDPSLIGQQYATDGSVHTTASKGMKARANLKRVESEDDSVQEEPPSDEELFAAGWAKALDPNSGSYYFFTLDRSKTVWENPLNPTQSEAGEYSI